VTDTVTDRHYWSFLENRKKQFKTLLTICLVAALFFGLTSAAGADGGRVIARCSLVEKSFVKSVHYDLKERNLRWQVSKKAGKYPWVRARLEENPEGAVIPETALAKNEVLPVKEKAILATMQFVAADDRPFDLGNAALGDVALAVYPAVDRPVRYALVKKDGRVLITHRHSPSAIQLTYSAGR